MSKRNLDQVCLAYGFARLSYFCLSSSARYVGTSLGSESAHLNTFYYLPASLFHFYLLEDSSFSNFCSSWAFSICLRAYCRRPSTASTAQRIQPCTKQHSKYVPIRARQRKQADRVDESREPACRRTSDIIQLAMFSKRRIKNLTGPRKYKTTHKAAVAGAMREGFVIICNSVCESTFFFNYFKNCPEGNICGTFF